MPALVQKSVMYGAGCGSSAAHLKQRTLPFAEFLGLAVEPRADGSIQERRATGNGSFRSGSCGSPTARLHGESRCRLQVDHLASAVHPIDFAVASAATGVATLRVIIVGFCLKARDETHSREQRQQPRAPPFDLLPALE